MTWYVEYERPVPVAAGTEGQDLRLSGHDLVLDEHVEALQYSFDRSTISGRSAATQGGGEGPAMVVMAVEDERTVLLLSYALPLAELRQLAESQIRFVDEGDWLSAIDQGP